MIAIDPGKKGGFAWYPMGSCMPKSLPLVAPMPSTDREITELLRPQYSPGTMGCASVAYLEDLVKFAGRNMPSSAMATYAGNWGFIRGVLTAFGYRIIIVPPKAWQKALGLGSSKSHPNKTAWKHHLKNRAEQLFPGVKVTEMTQDALLIFEAARRGLIG